MRNRTSTRVSATLGIAGGIVPCPEALAILLLAIGLHQAWLGMLAIVAFSVGLAGVLVAFGAVVALAQSRSTQSVVDCPVAVAEPPAYTWPRDPLAPAHQRRPDHHGRYCHVLAQLT